MSRSPKSDRPRIVLVNRCFIENTKKQILLLRRSSDDHWAKGKWEAPGGKLDFGQDLNHALEREVLEETNLSIITTDRVSYVEGEIITQGKYSGLPYVAIFGKSKLVGGKLKLSSEHSQSKWLSPSQALDLDLTSETNRAIVHLFMSSIKSS